MHQELVFQPKKWFEYLSVIKTNEENKYDRLEKSILVFRRPQDHWAQATGRTWPNPECCLHRSGGLLRLVLPHLASGPTGRSNQCSGRQGQLIFQGGLGWTWSRIAVAPDLRRLVQRREVQEDRHHHRKGPSYCGKLDSSSTFDFKDTLFCVIRVPQNNFDGNLAVAEALLGTWSPIVPAFT